MPRARVVSLVPSSTETLLALGADVVACTRFCEQPSLRHVGGTKNPDIDAIVALAPDVVVLDREENRREDHDALVQEGVRVVVSDVTTLAAGVDVVAQLAAAAGVDPSDADLPGPDSVGPRSVGPRRSAFVPIWRRPWMAIGAGTYGASLLDHLGVDLSPASDDPYPTIELTDVAAQHPDLVLVPSEPYVFKDEHLDELADALPGAHVMRVDGQDLFWWGVRTPAAVNRLRAALGHPPPA